MIKSLSSTSQNMRIKFCFVFVYLIINTTTIRLAQSYLLYYYCGNPENYTANSMYETNLNTIFSVLPTTNNGFGFYNLSTGQGNNTINSIALCRGDINPNVCLSCVNNAISRIRQLCSYKKDALTYYEYCSFIYSNITLLGNTDIWYYTYLSETQNTTHVDLFNGALRPLMDTLRVQASNGGPLKKFAIGNTTGPDATTIYALVQCTPDLSKRECNDCLDNLIIQIPSYFDGKVGGRIDLHMCNIRYDITLFFNESDNALVIPPSPSSTQPPVSTSPQPPVSTSPRPSPGKNTTQTVTIVIVTMTVIGGIVIASLCIWIRSKKRKKKQTPLIAPESETMDIGAPEALQYEFDMVKDATNNFSEDNKLGQGGFGAVYKGVFEDGIEIAVKRLPVHSGQGDVEFKNEVLTVAKLQHPNLVSLLGFCIHGNERLLIYESLPNASLDQFLVVDPVKREFLDCEKRCKIIKGVAEGLLYLHENPHLMIIHRDLKASNVLLDGEMNAKIAEFGMARLFKPDETHGNNSQIGGTYGYMAPEYAMHGQFSVKSDVFSFGVLVLEIVTGQRNQSFQNGDSIQDLLSFAWNCWNNRTWSDLIDPILKNRSGSLDDIIRSIHIGLSCSQDNITDRPTMDSVVLMLKSLSFTLPPPLEPALFICNNSTPGRPLLHEFSSLSGSIGLER